ncbi:hypothetical protein ACFQX7_30505 [Luedemannella flava]
MTTQIPDLVHYLDRHYSITAVDGTGLFDPARSRPPATGVEHRVLPGLHLPLRDP